MSSVTCVVPAWACLPDRGILRSLVDPRKKRIAAAAAAGVVVVTLALAWLWWIPAAIESRAESAIAERLGVRVDVGDVDMRIRGVVLSDVVLEGESGGLSIRIDEIGVRAGLFAAAIDGAAAIEEVQARHVAVDVDLTHDGFDASLATVREALARPAAAGEAQGSAEEQDDSPARALGAVLVNVSVDDAEGRLITLRGAHARLAGSAIEGGTAAVTVGAEPYDTLSADEVEFSAVRDAEGLRLAGLEVGSGDVSWAFREAPEEAENTEESGPRPTLERLASALGRLRGPEPEEVEPEPVSDESTLR